VAISNVIERLGKAIFEAPFGAHKLSKDAPELAEIRIAVLDAVKAKSHRASGKSVFPYNVVRLNLHGIPPEQASIFESEFLTQYFRDEIKAGLSRSNYRFPNDLRIDVITTATLPGAGEEWLTVETELEQPKSADSTREILQPARIEIMKGTANHAQLLLDVSRTNIGRTAEVFRESGPSRKNDLAFTEDNEVNRTVSREHAHILRSAKNEYRLVNDRTYKGEENCGIWIVRDGLSQAIHRSIRGTLLQDGDEIHLGNAILLFHTE
jgi:pSer/pThr/pTyr-binding forkhead associated (FHA) protein